MSTRRTLWIAFDVTVAPGAEGSVDAALVRWAQDLRHRTLVAGVDIHDGVARLLDVSSEDMDRALTLAAEMLRTRGDHA